MLCAPVCKLFVYPVLGSITPSRIRIIICNLQLQQSTLQFLCNRMIHASVSFYFIETIEQSIHRITMRTLQCSVLGCYRTLRK